MKKLDTSFITTQIGMPVKGGTLRHIQEAYTEPIAEAVKGLIGPNYNPNVTYILYGLFNQSAHPQYNITAGSVFRNGEVFLVDAVNINVGTQTAVLSTTLTYATGQDADGVEFTDGVIRNVHQINKAQLTAGIGGTTNLGNYADAQRINSNQPNVNITQGAGIAVTGAFPNFNIASTVSPGVNPILRKYNISLGDMNSDPEDPYTTRLDGGSNGQAAYLHTFPAALPDSNFSIWLQVGNGDHNTTAQFGTNYMCSALLGQFDSTKFYFSVQTTATSNVQQLQLNYIVIKNP